MYETTSVSYTILRGIPIRPYAVQRYGRTLGLLVGLCQGFSPWDPRDVRYRDLRLVFSQVRRGKDGRESAFPWAKGCVVKVNGTSNRRGNICLSAWGDENDASAFNRVMSRNVRRRPNVIVAYLGKLGGNEGVDDSRVNNGPNAAQGSFLRFVFNRFPTRAGICRLSNKGDSNSFK